MAITVFLSLSPGLLNRGPGGPASLGHGPHSSIFSPTYLRLWTPTAQSGVLLGAGSLYSILTPTDLHFLSPGLYNNLTSTLLPSSVTISHSIQPLDSQGHMLIFLDWMHLLFTQVHFRFWQLGRVGSQYATLAQSAEAGKYTDSVSAEGQTPTTKTHPNQIIHISYICITKI